MDDRLTVAQLKEIIKDMADDVTVFFVCAGGHEIHVVEYDEQNRRLNLCDYGEDTHAKLWEWY